MFISLEELVAKRLQWRKVHCYKFIKQIENIFWEKFFRKYPKFFEPSIEYQVITINQTQLFQQITRRNTIGVVITKIAMENLHLVTSIEDQNLMIQCAERWDWYWKLDEIEQNPKIWLTSKYQFPRNYARLYLAQKKIRAKRSLKRLKKCLILLSIICLILIVNTFKIK